jgi:hypothetical protein
MPGDRTDEHRADTRVVLATVPGTAGWPNEDFAAVAPGAAVLLDGATTIPRGTPTGCRHGVAWYARTLGSALLGGLVADPGTGLADALAAAIGDVRDRHADTCDLDNPATPAATVTAVRAEPSGFSFLALSDSSILADYGDNQEPQVITDNHQPARATPDAAARATTGTLAWDGLRGLALLSDGATRITDRYGLLGWPELLATIRGQGPHALIDEVRVAEAADADCSRWPRTKATDDATIIWWPVDAD